MGSDGHLTSIKYDWGNGNEIGKTRFPYTKLYVSRDGLFALGLTGVNDELYANFFNALLKGKYDLKSVIKKGKFEEFERLNASRWDGRHPKLEISNEFLLATRFEEPKLYHVWTLGRVEEITGRSLGGGSKYSGDHIQRELERTGRELPDITMSYALKLVNDGLIGADKDPHSSGLFDIVVATEEKMFNFEKEIKKRMGKARKDTFSFIREQVLI